MPTAATAAVRADIALPMAWLAGPELTQGYPSTSFCRFLAGLFLPTTSRGKAYLRVKVVQTLANQSTHDALRVDVFRAEAKTEEAEAAMDPGGNGGPRNRG